MDVLSVRCEKAKHLILIGLLKAIFVVMLTELSHSFSVDFFLLPCDTETLGTVLQVGSHSYKT